MEKRAAELHNATTLPQGRVMWSVNHKRSSRRLFEKPIGRLREPRKLWPKSMMHCFGMARALRPKFSSTWHVVSLCTGSCLVGDLAALHKANLSLPEVG